MTQFNSIQFVVCFLSLEVGSLDFIKFCVIWIANFVDLEILWIQTVKIDINIERDLAYALKVKECPQILFLRGNKILYREKGKAYCFHNRITGSIFKLLYFLVLMKIMDFAEFRTADELVQMIAHFYYNAKKPSCVNNANLCP